VEITEVRIDARLEGRRVKAFASIAIDGCLMIHGIALLHGRNGYFLQMPGRRVGDGWRAEIAFPLNPQTRHMIRDKILAEYEKSTVKAAV
jgi:stage V sporulation protein G